MLCRRLFCLACSELRHLRAGGLRRFGARASEQLLFVKSSRHIHRWFQNCSLRAWGVEVVYGGYRRAPVPYQDPLGLWGVSFFAGRVVVHVSWLVLSSLVSPTTRMIGVNAGSTGEWGLSVAVVRCFAFLELVAPEGAMCFDLGQRFKGMAKNGGGRVLAAFGLWLCTTFVLRNKV